MTNHLDVPAMDQIGRYFELRNLCSQQDYQNRMQELKFKQALAQRAVEAQLSVHAAMWGAPMGTGSAQAKEHRCRYCGTKRQDKAHNCRNCAGLETV